MRRVLLLLTLALSATLLAAPAQAVEKVQTPRARALAKARECHEKWLMDRLLQASDVQYHEGTAKRAAYFEYFGPEQTAAVKIPLQGPRAMQTTQAVHYDGIAYANKSWAGQPAPWVIYRMHVRMSVTHQFVGTCAEADYFAYRSNHWCTEEPSPTSSGPTPCAVDVRGASLKKKSCTPDVACPSSEPWGQRDFYDGNTTGVIFNGALHADSAGSSHLSNIDRMAYRFINPDHRTFTYRTCSWWTWHKYDPELIHATDCTGDLIGV